MLWELKLVSVMVIMRLTPNVLLVCGGSHRLGQNWPTQPSLLKMYILHVKYKDLYKKGKYINLISWCLVCT